MVRSLNYFELPHAPRRVNLVLFRHLFNLFELMVDDLIEDDRYQAAEHIIKNFMKKSIKNMNNYK